MDLLDGDIVLVAGVTGRVGGATLRLLADESARVIVLARSDESAQAAIGANVSGDARSQVSHVVADLLDPVSTDRAVDEAFKKHGRLDAVVSLAGRGKFVPLVESTVEDLRLNVDGFLVCAYNLALSALRRMLAQPIREGRQSRGHIVMVTAGSSQDPQPRFGLFGSAKAGVNILMRAIAREHKGDGIVANAVVLGGVATEAARRYLSPEDFATAASPAEVARVLAFLASSRSSGINGELIDLNAREVV